MKEEEEKHANGEVEEGEEVLETNPLTAAVFFLCPFPSLEGRRNRVSLHCSRKLRRSPPRTYAVTVASDVRRHVIFPSLPFSPVQTEKTMFDGGTGTRAHVVCAPVYSSLSV